MAERLALTALSFVALAVVYGALERAFPARAARRWRDASFLTDGCFFLGQYLLWSSVAVAVLSWFHGVVNAHASAALRTSFAGLPLWLLAAVAVVSGDLLVYWFHRACHRFDFLWRFHSVHHSAERLDWLAAHREHPVDGVLTQLAQNLPAMVLGLPIEVLAVLIAFRGAWSILIHSNVRLPLGPLRVLFGAPELHHYHHARVERTAHNFGNVAPWLDLLFGTYHRPRGPETYPLGLCEPGPEGYLAQLLQPLLGQRLRRSTRATERKIAPERLESAARAGPLVTAQLEMIERGLELVGVENAELGRNQRDGLGRHAGDHRLGEDGDPRLRRSDDGVQLGALNRGRRAALRVDEHPQRWQIGDAAKLPDRA